MIEFIEREIIVLSFQIVRYGLKIEEAYYKSQVYVWKLKIWHILAKDKGFLF